MRSDMMNHEILKRADAVISGQIADGSVVGASLCVIKDGNEVFRNNYGQASKEKGIPMKNDTIFRCYSMTKPVTATAAMILVERGEMNLTDPVWWFLPGFKNQKVLTEKGLVDAKRDVTIQDLLDMTAGLVYPDAGFPAGAKMQELYDEVEAQLKAGKPTSTIDLCNRIGEQPLEFQPGEGWRYSVCADVIGALVEIISGKKYSQFLADEIFTPLGMKDTAFYVPEEKQDRFMEYYQYMDETGTMEPCTWQHLGLSYFWKQPPAFESGGAGLVSTIDDYSKFAQMLCNGGTYNGVRILGRKTLEYMTSNHLNPLQLKHYDWDTLYGYGYGCLMRVMMDTGVHGSNGTKGEYGWDGWMGSYFFVDPAEKLIMIYVIQKCGGNGYRNVARLRNIVYAAIED